MLSRNLLRPHRASIVGGSCFLGASPQAIDLRAFSALRERLPGESIEICGFRELHSDTIWLSFQMRPEGVPGSSPGS